jgi:hypothetical protein
MDEERDNLLESDERLRIYAAWLGRMLEGTVNTTLWRGDPNVFYFETDDGEVYAIERNDPSLRLELADAS